MPSRHQTITKNSQFMLILLITYAIFAGSSNAQEDVIRIDTNLVSIPTTVLDRDGRYITDLKKEDFQIFENEIEQEIALFETNEQPFTTLILLDISGSMNDTLRNAFRAINVFVKQLRPNDQIIVATFNNSAKIKIELQATKKSELTSLIINRWSGSGMMTGTFDAISEAVKYMKKFTGRRAIIIYGDGEQFGYNKSAKRTLREAEEQEALIYTLRFGNESTGKYFEHAGQYMQSLAQKTGGRAYQIDEYTDLEKTFGGIADELGKQYNLSYYPKSSTGAGNKRQIKVKTRLSNLVVRARNEYTSRQ